MPYEMFYHFLWSNALLLIKNKLTRKINCQKQFEHPVLL